MGHLRYLWYLAFFPLPAKVGQQWLLHLRTLFSGLALVENFMFLGLEHGKLVSGKFKVDALEILQKQSITVRKSDGLRFHAPHAFPIWSESPMGFSGICSSLVMSGLLNPAEPEGAMGFVRDNCEQCHTGRKMPSQACVVPSEQGVGQK